MESYLYKNLFEHEETHWWHRAKRELVLKKLRQIKSTKALKILDIGCGTGKNMQSFGSFGEVWGIDTASEAISFCKKRGLKNVKKNSAYAIDFPDGHFDVITMLDVLEHTDDVKALEQVYRKLKKGGVFICTVPAFGFLWSKWDEILHHHRRYSRDTLSTQLKKSKFRVKKITYAYSFLLLPVFVVRLFKRRQGDNYTSDFSHNPKIIDTLLYRLAMIEQFFMKYLSIPFGTSIFAIAKKM